MITGEDFSRAVSRSGLTIPGVAEHLRTSERTILNWKQRGVPPHRESFVDALMGAWLTPGVDLSTVGLVELLAEVCKRVGVTAEALVHAGVPAGHGDITAAAGTETLTGSAGGLQGKNDRGDPGQSPAAAADPTLAQRARWSQSGISDGAIPTTLN